MSGARGPSGFPVLCDRIKTWFAGLPVSVTGVSASKGQGQAGHRKPISGHRV